MWRVTWTGSPEVLRVSESSPYSAETSFRELDDAFLQTQTRIWLGEVLHVRFDEDVGIADLLADGELLYRYRIYHQCTQPTYQAMHYGAHAISHLISSRSFVNYKYAFYFCAGTALNPLPTHMKDSPSYTPMSSSLTPCALNHFLKLHVDEPMLTVGLLFIFVFQVSKEVWKMLLRKHGELKHSKVHIYERTSSRKSDGRYMPYPKVDSFLKICQILGLTGIDLFSPSDVVEKRDIRRVCMCVRSLSKKARSKKLNVPDFDIVTYTIAMPTCLVGGIRKNLELLWGSPSSFNINSPSSDTREICELSQHSETRSDESESYFSDLEFKSPFFSASYDSANNTNLVGETSPELSPITDDFVHETSFSNRIKNSSHYEVVHERQEEMLAESAYTHHLNTTATYTPQNMSSSSYSEHPTDEDSGICFSDIEKRSADSITKVVKNRIKAENLSGTLYAEASYETSMNASSLDIATSEDNQHSHLKVHGNVEVESYNTRQESSVFENACDSNLERSDSTIARKNAYSFFSSFVDKQNNFSRGIVGRSSERNQNEPVHTSLSSIKCDCALLSQSDDPKYLAKRKCGSQSTKFECSSSSSMCLTHTDINIEDGSYLVAENCILEDDVYKANSMTTLNDSLSTLVPVVQENIDIAAHMLSLEEEKFFNVASYRSFDGQFMSSSLNSETDVGSNKENDQIDATYQSCETQEHPQVVQGNWSEEPCLRYNFHMFDSVSENKMSEFSLELIKNNDSSSNDTHIISEQQSSPEKEDSVEHTDDLFSEGITSVDDSDCSDELKMHQCSHDASEIAFLISIYESKIPPSKKARAMRSAYEESSVNPENCHDGGKLIDFGHQTTKRLNSFYSKDLEVLDAMESSYSASHFSASEMIPTFYFCRTDRSHRNVLETEGETIQIVDILPSSIFPCREREEVALGETIEVEKHIVSYIHDDCAEPRNVPQSILVNASSLRNGAYVRQAFGEGVDSLGLTHWLAENQTNQQSKDFQELQSYMPVIAENALEADSIKVDSRLIITENAAETSSHFHIANKTLFLFEEVDVVFDEDHGFISTIFKLAETTKRPIILTSNTKRPVLPHLLDRLVLLDFEAPSYSELLYHASMICAFEKVHVSYGLLEHIIMACVGDIRRILMLLQFWCQGFRDITEKSIQCTNCPTPFDIDAVHLAIPRVISYDLRCELSERVEEEISKAVSALEENSIVNELLQDNVYSWEFTDPLEKLNATTTVKSRKKGKLRKQSIIGHTELSDYVNHLEDLYDSDSPSTGFQRKAKQKPAVVLSSESDDELLSDEVKPIDISSNHKLSSDELKHEDASTQANSYKFLAVATSPAKSLEIYEVSQLDQIDESRNALVFQNSFEISEVASTSLVCGTSRIKDVDTCMSESSFISGTETNMNFTLGSQEVSNNSCYTSLYDLNISPLIHPGVDLNNTNGGGTELFKCLENHIGTSDVHVELLKTNLEIGCLQNEEGRPSQRQLVEDCAHPDFIEQSMPRDSTACSHEVASISKTWKRLRSCHPENLKLLSSKSEDVSSVASLTSGLADLLSEADIMFSSCNTIISDNFEPTSTPCVEPDSVSWYDEHLEMGSTFTQHGLCFFTMKFDTVGSCLGLGCNNTSDLPQEMLASSTVSTALGKLLTREIISGQNSCFKDSGVETPPSFNSIRRESAADLYSAILPIVPARLSMVLKGLAFHEYLSYVGQISRFECSRLAESSLLVAKQNRRSRTRMHYLSSDAHQLSSEQAELLAQRTCFTRSSCIKVIHN